MSDVIYEHSLIQKDKGSTLFYGKIVWLLIYGRKIVDCYFIKKITNFTVVRKIFNISNFFFYEKSSTSQPFDVKLFVLLPIFSTLFFISLIDYLQRSLVSDQPNNTFDQEENKKKWAHLTTPLLPSEHHCSGAIADQLANKTLPNFPAASNCSWRQQAGPSHDFFKCWRSKTVFIKYVEVGSGSSIKK